MSNVRKGSTRMTVVVDHDARDAFGYRGEEVVSKFAGVLAEMDAFVFSQVPARRPCRLCQARSQCPTFVCRSCPPPAISGINLQPRGGRRESLRLLARESCGLIAITSRFREFSHQAVVSRCLTASVCITTAVPRSSACALAKREISAMSFIAPTSLLAYIMLTTASRSPK